MTPLLPVLKRTGKFTDLDERKCLHYARFLRDISRQQADAIFWSLFILVLMLLTISSGMYTRASRTLTEPERALESGSNAIRTTHTHIRNRCLLVSMMCSLVAIPAVVIEAFAAFSIEFCDGEDLMMLYWGFWSILQFGSLIAILGVTLNQWYGLRNLTQPPWAVALGTPVLIVAALAHAGMTVVGERRARRSSSIETRGRQSAKASRSGSVTPSVACIGATLSRSTTIVDKPPIGSRFLGWTLDQQPIYAFPADCGFPQMGSRNCSLVDPIPMSLAATQGDATPEEPTSEMPRMSSKETSTEREVKFAASA